MRLLPKPFGFFGDRAFGVDTVTDRVDRDGELSWDRCQGVGHRRVGFDHRHPVRHPGGRDLALTECCVDDFGHLASGLCGSEDTALLGVVAELCQCRGVQPCGAVALLGVTRPGIGTLATIGDIASLYGVAESVAQNTDWLTSVAASAGTPVTLRFSAASGPSSTLTPRQRVLIRAAASRRRHRRAQAALDIIERNHQ